MKHSAKGKSVAKVREWISYFVDRTRESHIGSTRMRLVSPEYEVIELHVNRAERVARYWLSSLAGVEAHPIVVPSWKGLGYLNDMNGTVLMHLRENPRAALRPGQRGHVISCNCNPDTKRNKCRTCKCTTHRVSCSSLCKCKLSCDKQMIPSESHAMEIEREGEKGLSTQREHGAGAVATVGHDRPEEHHFLFNGITGHDEIVSGTGTPGMHGSVREVNDSVSVASVEGSSAYLFGFTASDIAEYSTHFEGESHSDVSLPTV